MSSSTGPSSPSSAASLGVWDELLQRCTNQPDPMAALFGEMDHLLDQMARLVRDTMVETERPDQCKRRYSHRLLMLNGRMATALGLSPGPWVEKHALEMSSPASSSDEEQSESQLDKEDCEEDDDIARRIVKRVKSVSSAALAGDPEPKLDFRVQSDRFVCNVAPCSSTDVVVFFDSFLQLKAHFDSDHAADKRSRGGCMTVEVEDLDAGACFPDDDHDEDVQHSAPDSADDGEPACTESCSQSCSRPSSPTALPASSSSASELFACKECSFTAKTRPALSFHRKLKHKCKSSYRCDECGKAFPVKAYYIQHLGSHVKTNDCICDVCGKGFKNERYLSSHMKHCHSNARYACADCGKSYAQQSGYRAHRQLKHSDKPVDRSTCEFCAKTFATANTLRFHQAVVHGEDTYKNILQCSSCPRKFISEAKLKEHVNAKHGGFRMPCPHCGKEYYDKYGVNKHLREKKCPALTKGAASEDTEDMDEGDDDLVIEETDDKNAE